MACRFPLHSSLHSQFLSPENHPRLPRNSRSISCQKNSVTSDVHDDADDNEKGNKTQVNLLAIPITLTVISASLAQPSLAAATKASERKKTQKKPQEAWTLEQLKAWSKDLPVVSKRIPYTDILSLKAEGKLKHLIKPSSLCLRQKAEPVLVVLEDSQVLRTVLPSLEGNKRLAQNSNMATALGLVFFYIFYRVVVLNYRKQKKDYEDRLKIEKAEAEERKKMRELEREMQGIEEEDEEVEEGTGEKNSYLKMATQFMKSGARVRRASNRRLPEYLERGVDVKFTDVAGLGKIRLELEEIVKFFTHGEMYRRRGVKIGFQKLFYGF